MLYNEHVSETRPRTPREYAILLLQMLEQHRDELIKIDTILILVKMLNEELERHAI